MEEYSKYIILSHLHWIENNISPDAVLNIYQEIKNLDINEVFQYLNKKKNINDFRVNIIREINKDNMLRFHYFNLAKNNLYCLVGNELMMQKNINLSIPKNKITAIGDAI